VLLRWLLAVAVLGAAACSTSPDDPGEPGGAGSSPAGGPAVHLALGDSVAAGTGAADPASGGYVPLLTDLLSDRLGCGADATAPGCPLQLENLAVAGATTATLLRDQLPAALARLRDDPDVRLVTVTVGGNDVFLPVVTACARAPQDAACDRAVEQALQAVDDGVDRVLSALAGARGPTTTVAVMTYYDPLPACRLAPLQPLAAQVLEGRGDDRPGLNDLLRDRAAEHGAVVVETGERLTDRDDFVGDLDCLHPSDRGHERIAEAFSDAVGDDVADARAGR
jgi:lysophospholipase L1-like esterase